MLVSRSGESKRKRHARGQCLGCPKRTYKGRWYCFDCRRWRTSQAVALKRGESLTQRVAA
jgi:lipopolysaccharide biosynthesis regulator YciM